MLDEANDAQVFSMMLSTYLECSKPTCLHHHLTFFRKKKNTVENINSFLSFELVHNKLDVSSLNTCKKKLKK